MINPQKKEASFLFRARMDLKKYKTVYLLALPMVLYYLIFRYVPMYGAIIAFQDYRPLRGIGGSDFVGFAHFLSFFQSVYFFRLLKNTLIISLQSLLFCFPAPIVLALVLNEVRNPALKKMAQTVSYLPHFISLVVICGLISNFTAEDGLLNDLIALGGGKRQTMLLNPALFRPVYILSEIWQGIGWGSIIYLSALAGVDVQLYEAARIDGAGRLKQTLHITLPGIAPTIIIMLILRIGRIMDVGYEKIMLLYNEVTYETADVISTYVYRKGLMNGEFDFSTAVGLFNSVINFILIVMANAFSRRVSDTSLW
jgi:putative aldouronate transport system permease protein